MRVHAHRNLEPGNDRIDSADDVLQNLVSGGVGEVDDLRPVGLELGCALGDLRGWSHVGHHQKADRE